MKLFDFMRDPALCGDAFKDGSWHNWGIVARLYDGDAALLTEDEKAIALELIGKETLPTEAPRELFLGVGRRAGKTRFDALLAVHAAAEDRRDKLSAGEWAHVICTCVDRTQARTWFGYTLGLIEASPILSAEVTNKTSDSIEFAHRSRIEVFTSNFRSVRGFTLALAIIDEAAFLPAETSASPDIELYRALTPGLATLNGRLVVTSSLHRKQGLMWQKYRAYHGEAA
jgi:phage terminase large subunit-like protein